MKVSEINLETALPQQISEHVISDTQPSEYMVDCYPYAMRGFLWGLVLSAASWFALIGIYLLLF
jgi:hypothetical protein